MIKFDEEIKKYDKMKYLDEVEEMIYEEDTEDLIDIIKDTLKMNLEN